MATESFILPECLISLMNGWGGLSWEEIYAEHRPLVDRVFEADERINYLSKMYNSETIERAKLRCVDGLGEIVDGFRADQSHDAQPKDIDWADFFWKRGKKEAIRQKLLTDDDLKKAMKQYHEQYTTNIAICVAQEYNTQINDRNNATY